jgi:hypothetical protein
MSCIYLEHKEHKPLCYASLSQLTPEVSDLVKYCESEDRSNCPIRLAHLFRNEFRSRTINRVTQSVSYGC